MRRSLSLATIALSAAALLIAPIARAESDDSLPSPNAWTATSPTPATIDAAVAALPGIVRQVQAKTGIPGIAIVQANSVINYLIGLVIAFGAAFVISFALKYQTDSE